MKTKTHKNLEFAVNDNAGQQRTFKKFDEACVFAVSQAMPVLTVYPSCS